MIKDGQCKELRRLLSLGKPLAASARMAEMTEKTARKYRDDNRLPSQRKKSRDYRTRMDPFAEIWPDVQRKLEEEPALKAMTLFQWLQETHPGRFPDSNRRTFERRVATWRSLYGPNRTVYFGQIHHPGRLAASDFTVCNELGVTIARERFDHTLFHCVLTYSNVESISLCFSESFEALSAGVQKAFWEFGGVPQRHRSDSLSAAIRNHSSQKAHTHRYAGLMSHYGCEAERTNVRCANENGDVESSNGHIKDRIDQALLLRGSRDFASRPEYTEFLEQLINRGNANRSARFLEEQAGLRPLPEERLDTDDILPPIRVSKSSTIQVRTNTYSVPSRLIGQCVDVRVAAEQITVTHQGHLIQTIPRLVGKKQASINYRHIIHSLVRKPGAFANFKYREEMFPTSQFRIAYDILRGVHTEKVADKTYLKILELAAQESEEAVIDSLRHLIAGGEAITIDRIRTLIASATSLPAVTDIQIDVPLLSDFDCLLSMPELLTTFNKECPNYDQNYEICIDEARCADEQNEVVEQCTTENHTDPNQPAASIDGAVSGTATARLSGSLRGDSNEGGNRESQSPGVSVGTDNSGMRSASGRSHQTHDDSIEASVRQDLGNVQVRPTAAECDAPTGDSSRRIVSEPSREHSDIWQAGFGEKSYPLCTCRTTDSAGTQHSVHNLQPAGSAVAHCQTRPASVEIDQTTVELRGTDHRRSGVRATEPRRDGSAVYPSGGTLRTWERPADEQSPVQQMGPDLQGRYDDSSRHRSTGTPQCHHRAERAQLPCRNSSKQQIAHTDISEKTTHFKFVAGNSNCR